MRELKSTWLRYAFGYSDERPGPWFWVLLVVVLGFIVFTMISRSEAAECLNKKEARREWPGHYLSWRGDHCWYSPRAEKEARASRARAEVLRLEREKEPIEPEAAPVSSEKPASGLLRREEPSTEPREVLLFQKYLDRKLEEDRRGVAATEEVPRPPPATVPSVSVHDFQSDKEGIGALRLMAFLVILSGSVLVAAGGFGLVRAGGTD